MLRIFVTTFLFFTSHCFADFQIPSPNVGVIEFSHPEKFSRIVALSDVHGMYSTLHRLFLSTRLIDSGLHWRGSNTLVVVVGDSIDKGPDSVNVLDFWMALIPQARAAGGEIVHLLGNHEAEFLADPSNPKAKELLNELKLKGIDVRQLTDPSFPRGRLMRNLPLAARVGNWLFCHSGFYPKTDFMTFRTMARNVLQGGDYSNPFLIGPESVLQAKNWWANPNSRQDLESRLYLNHFYGVVFGHQPEALSTSNHSTRDSIAAADQLRLIKVDSGMNPNAGGYAGHLLVFTQPSDLSKMQAPRAFSMSVLGDLTPLSWSNGPFQ